MKIIIVGLGQTGMLLAECASEENHDVVVIDSNKKAVDQAIERLNVNGIVGSGASHSVLTKAGAQTTDMLIAVTANDEVNLMIGIAAKSNGVEKVAVRIRHPEFDADAEYIREKYGIDVIINSEKEVAEEIKKRIKLPGALGVETFFHDNVVLFEVHANSVVTGKNMQEIRQLLGDHVLVTSVVREGKVTIPKGGFVVEQRDRLEILTDTAHMKEIWEKFGKKTRDVKNIFMAGCRTTGVYLADALDHSKVKITILEQDREQCIALSGRFPQATVVWGDAVDTKTLWEEGIQKNDMCIALTGDDRTNLAVSLYAKSCGTEYTVTKINDLQYERLLRNTSIDATVSTAQVTVSRIMSMIRNSISTDRSTIQKIYGMAGGLAEALEFLVTEDCKAAGIPFASPQFCLKKGFLIACIVRSGEVLIPNGKSMLLPGDTVIVVSEKKKGVDSLNNLFG